MMSNIEIEQELDDLFEGFDPMAEVYPDEEDVNYNIPSEQDSLIFDPKPEVKERKDQNPTGEVNNNDVLFEELGIPAYKKKKEGKQQDNKCVSPAPDITCPEPEVLAGDEKSLAQQNGSEKHSSNDKELPNPDHQEAEKGVEQGNFTSPPTEKISEDTYDEVEDCEILTGDIDETIIEDLGNAGDTFHEREPEKEEQQVFRVSSNEDARKKDATVHEREKIDNIINTIKEYCWRKEVVAGLKRAGIFAMMLIVIAGIPLGLSLIRQHQLADGSENSMPEDVNSDIWIETVGKMGDFNEIINEHTETINTNSRFQTLSDLTLYVSSEQGVILSKEKTLVMQYNAGFLSKKQFLSEMDELVSLLDETNHLLIVNKPLFIEKGEQEIYETLYSNMETVMSYGDREIYNAKQNNDTILDSNVEELWMEMVR